MTSQEKIESKVAKIKSKILALEVDQEYEERKAAFDLIMELGEKHKLFQDVETLCEVGFGIRTTLNITMIDPTRTVVKEV